MIWKICFASICGMFIGIGIAMLILEIKDD